MPVSKLISRFLCIVLIAGSLIPANGQALVNTTGKTIKNNSYSFEYSIGEIAITTISNSNKSCTQGLLQPDLKRSQAHAFLKRDLAFEKVKQKIFKKNKPSAFNSHHRYLSASFSKTASF